MVCGEGIRKEALQYPYRDFIARQGKNAPVEGDHEGNTQPLEPHRRAILVLAEDGAGGYTEGFHDEGEGVSDGQPKEKALVLVRAVDGVEDETVEDEEEAVGC